jgi:hypothetical protein
MIDHIKTSLTVNQLDISGHLKSVCSGRPERETKPVPDAPGVRAEEAMNQQVYWR